MSNRIVFPMSCINESTAIGSLEHPACILSHVRRELEMDELLKFALKAYGGLKRWTELTEIKADLSVTGALWQVKNQVDTLKHIRIEADLRQQRMTTHVIGQNKRLHFTPDSVSAETEDGILLERRDQPRALF
jgi:hypothetical protein